MADKTPVTMQLFRIEGTVPPPDDLIAGSKGAVYTDIVKVSVAGEFKRGTLMMSGSINADRPCNCNKYLHPQRGYRGWRKRIHRDSRLL